MQFLFWLGNHNKEGQRSLEDVIGIMGHQMRALGHAAVWDPANEKFVVGEGNYNVVVEGFTPGVVKIIADGHATGAKFICLATEEPSAKGFNQGTQKEMVMRQETFPTVAPYLDGIIHLVPGQHVTDWYGQFAPTAYAELGYAPSLMRKAKDIEPDYDFGFYGSVTPRRLRILKRLANRIGTEKAIKIVADFKTQEQRDQEMRRARVIVQIRKFEAMGLVSSSRCNTALCIGRPVIAEPHLLSKPWDEIVSFASSIERFYDQAIMVRAMWRGIHADQLDKFKKKLPPQACIGQALEKIGLVGHSQTRAA